MTPLHVLYKQPYYKSVILKLNHKHKASSACTTNELHLFCNEVVHLTVKICTGELPQNLMFSISTVARIVDRFERTGEVT